MSPSQTEPSPTASASSPGVSIRPVIRRVAGSRRDSVSSLTQSVSQTPPSPTARSVTTSPRATVVRATTRPALGSTLTIALVPMSFPSTQTAPSPTATATGSEIPSGILGGNAPLDSPTFVRKPRPPEALTTQAIAPSAAITERGIGRDGAVDSHGPLDGSRLPVDLRDGSVRGVHHPDPSRSTRDRPGISSGRDDRDDPTCRCVELRDRVRHQHRRGRLLAPCEDDGEQGRHACQSRQRRSGGGEHRPSRPRARGARQPQAHAPRRR